MVRISDSELEVMKIIWRRKKATSLEIIKDLKGFKWNANTIRTLIKRLHIKGAIEVVQKEGKTFTYQATVKESDYKISATKKFLNKLYNDSLEELVMHYCQSKEVTLEEMKELEKSIDEMISKKGKKK